MADEQFDPEQLKRELQAIRERLKRLGGEGEQVMRKLDETISEAEKRLKKAPAEPD